MQSHSAAIVELLRRQHRTIAVAESMTGGLLALRLTETPDSGEIFRGAVVAYLSGVKHELLSVPEGPVVTADCAEWMARGVTELLHADVSLSTTGVAGPRTQEDQPVGTAFVGYCIDGVTGSQQLDLAAAGDPRSVRQATVDAGLALLRRRLSDMGSRDTADG
jgi:PncC family amidohydrolase